MQALAEHQELLHHNIQQPIRSILPQQAIIDCCLGSNPFGPPIALDTIQTQVDANEYLTPQASDDLAFSMARFFDLSPEYMNLNGGSASCITTLFSRFLNPTNRLMLGVTPQFIHGVQEWVYFGGRYTGLPLINPDQQGQKPLVEQLITKIQDERPDIVYLDNPNNPTGFFFEINEVYEIVKACKTFGAMCIIDEAYIDYIPKEHSAIYLIPEFDHLIVLKSLSKGFGLAALRIGCTLAQPQIIQKLNQLTTPFPISTPSLYIAQHVFDHVDLDTYFQHSAQFAAQCKFQLLQTLENRGFHVPTTHPQIPIFTLTHPEISVIEQFEKISVLTTNSRSYGHFYEGPEFVRLRIPRTEREIYQLCHRIEQIQ